MKPSQTVEEVFDKAQANGDIPFQANTVGDLKKILQVLPDGLRITIYTEGKSVENPLIGLCVEADQWGLPSYEGEQYVDMEDARFMIYAD